MHSMQRQTHVTKSELMRRVRGRPAGTTPLKDGNKLAIFVYGSTPLSVWEAAIRRRSTRSCTDTAVRKPAPAARRLDARPTQLG